MYVFIVNPVSGSGKGKNTWLKLEPVLRVRQINYSVYFTKGPKDAIAIVKEVLTDTKLKAIVAVGGDGTVHEVAQELIGTDIPLGYIPAGSGNDFARALKISNNSTKALERILSFQPCKIDVGQINQIYFINGAGIGFDGAVAKLTNDTKRKRWLNHLRLGRFIYLVNALKILYTFRPTNLMLTIDGQSYFFYNVWMVAVSNIPFYGGGMMICPKANQSDGFLDICIVKDINRFQFLMNLTKVFQGKHVNQLGILMKRAKEICIKSQDPLPVHTDGEFYRNSPVLIKVLDRVLHVL
jgi:YegS/Rv2252/BmrU family lipid kinase